MKPNPVLRGLVVVVVVVGYAWLFGALLLDTLDADKAFEPGEFTSQAVPILSGALGLVLAVALGVEIKAAGLADATRVGRLKALLRIDNLLLAGAIVYLFSAAAGGYVWNEQGGDITPELVKVVVLTVIGYGAATVAAAARP
jgi:hypothetical protein